MVGERKSRDISPQPVRDSDARLLMSSNQARRLSRSPRPYHRRKLRPYYEANGSYFANAATESLALAERALSPSNFDSVVERHRELGGRSRPKDSNSSSISGSEADDESPMLLKGLPPPPFASRKGLRATQGVDQESPAVTPGLLSGVGRSLSAEFTRQQGALADQRDRSEATKKKVERFKRRRRGELVRRILETGLVGLVGGIVLRRDEVWQKAREMIGGIILLFTAFAWSAKRGSFRRAYRLHWSYYPNSITLPTPSPVLLEQAYASHRL